MNRITRLSIDNYRVFDRLEMRRVGRVNLLLGPNGSGKSTVLDAVEALYTAPPLGTSLLRRGEFRLSGHGNREGFECHVASLFHGHHLGIGQRYAIHAEEEGISGHREFRAAAEVVESRPTIAGAIPPFDKPAMSLLLSNGREKDADKAGTFTLPLTAAGTFAVEGTPEKYHREMAHSFLPGYRRCDLLPSGGLENEDLYRFWEQVVLTPAQEQLVRNMNILHPGIREIAPIQTGGAGGHTFHARLDGAGSRVPLGSLGDGVGRLFGLSLALAVADSGILLIDEVESGLHFTTMPLAWEMILSASQKNDIQVFVTTHSRDCLEALASHSRAASNLLDGTLIHTLRPDSRETVIFEPHEFDSIVEHGLEVRR